MNDLLVYDDNGFDRGMQKTKFKNDCSHLLKITL
jgi:hypothetical protein